MMPRRDNPRREQQPMPVPADSYRHEFLFSELADAVGSENGDGGALGAQGSADEKRTHAEST